MGLLQIQPTKLAVVLKNNDLAILHFKKKIHTCQLELTNLSPVQKVNLPPATYPLTQRLGPQIPASMKMGWSIMLKGQLSRVPWPVNSWVPLIFLWALQQLHKHSYIL